ncbi:MAG: polyprenyl synthetase family protein [Chlamydiota bacterium]
MVSTKVGPDLSLLNPLQEQFESDLRGHIAQLGNKTKLRDACSYALLNGGKRIRPLLVMVVAKALKNGLDVKEAALSVEYFHTASLIADDLPCMDNDDLRRDQPSLHCVFGEAVALLASYALISAAYEKIFTSTQVLKRAKEPFCLHAHETCSFALAHAARCAGILGATGGQFLDLFSKTSSLQDIKNIIYKKTVTLFEVCFVFGWVFGGGDLKQIEKVKQAAFHFGMAFQIADDFDDFSHDKKQSFNIVRCLGVKKSQTLFREEVNLLKLSLKQLALYTPEFRQVLSLLIGYQG